VGLGALFIAQNYISSNLYFLMRIGLLVFIATSFYNIVLGILRAERKVDWYSSFTIWNSVIGLGLGIMLVICFHRGVEGLLWGSLLSMVLAFPWY
jgi:O-antigen/teichoic acid export membrane protein